MMRSKCPAEARSASLALCGLEVPVVVERSRRRRRNLAIAVRHQQGIVVRVPQRFPAEQLAKVLAEHGDWLARQVEGMLQAGGYPGPKPLQDGDRLAYLGDPVVLRLGSASRSAVRLEGNELIVQCAGQGLGHAGQEEVVRLLEQWYRQRARTIIQAAVERLAAVMELAAPPFRITGARGRWGSCGRSSLNFSWRLVTVAPELIDYVVVHELCHLRQHNHSPAFWRLVKEVCPAWRQRRAALRQAGVGCCW